MKDEFDEKFEYVVFRISKYCKDYDFLKKVMPQPDTKRIFENC